MAGKRIVSTAPIDRTAVDILENIAPVEIASSPDEQTMLGLLEETIGIVCRGEGKVTRLMIETAEQLAVIGRPGVGYDPVDIDAATQRRIPVVFAPIGGFAVAEGALAMLLALVKKLPWCDQVVKSGQWQRRYETKTGDITEHTLGIVGLGRIGTHFAKLVRPFEMTVLSYDPVVDQRHMADQGIEKVELDELMRRSDYVSIHVPLADQTRGLISRERIALMKEGAILINTSRGGVIESLDVLADALQIGQLSAVGLDVFPVEPPDVSHRLFKDSRCLCAPHLVGVSTLAMERLFQSMATDMVLVLQGRSPKFCVNPEVLA